LRALLARNYGSLRIVNNPHWQDGIASSLLAGVNAVPRDARGVLILLTDQPGISGRSLQRLVDAWRRQPSRAIAAGYGGDLGVPAILPRRLLRDLGELKHDVGAKAVLRDAGSKTLVVEMPEAAFDVDTNEDRLRLTERLR
jgi:molybdenum cofactor cytidylyltransferase